MFEGKYVTKSYFFLPNTYTHYIHFFQFYNILKVKMYTIEENNDAGQFYKKNKIKQYAERTKVNKHVLHL